MNQPKDRAVSVVFHEDRLLVIRRSKNGRRYSVLPGGGVEVDEEPPDAALRELLEETGLEGTVDHHLWTVEHPDRVAHYYLVVANCGPLVLGGPESLAQSDQNRYTPAWIPLDHLDAEDLQPQEVRALLREVQAKE